MFLPKVYGSQFAVNTISQPIKIVTSQWKVPQQPLMTKPYTKAVSSLDIPTSCVNQKRRVQNYQKVDYTDELPKTRKTVQLLTVSTHKKPGSVSNLVADALPVIQPLDALKPKVSFSNDQVVMSYYSSRISYKAEPIRKKTASAPLVVMKPPNWIKYVKKQKPVQQPVQPRELDDIILFDHISRQASKAGNSKRVNTNQCE